MIFQPSERGLGYVLMIHETEVNCLCSSLHAIIKVKPFMYGHLSFCRRYKATAKNTLLTIVYIKNTETTAVKYSPNSHV